MRDDAALDHGAEADCVEQVAGPAGAAGMRMGGGPPGAWLGRARHERRRVVPSAVVGSGDATLARRCRLRGPMLRSCKVLLVGTAIENENRAIET